MFGSLLKFSDFRLRQEEADCAFIWLEIQNIAFYKDSTLNFLQQRLCVIHTHRSQQ